MTPYDGQRNVVKPFPRERTITPFSPFSPAAWDDIEPVFDWVVPGLFLRGTVGLVSGDGGLGKSLLAQQLLSCAAAGKPWLGFDVPPLSGFGLFCEDPEPVLKKRQIAINRHYGIDKDDLKHIHYLPRLGLDNALVRFDRKSDRANIQPLYHQLRQHVIDIGAQVIVIDTVADVFDGFEISRQQVRTFIAALRQIAIETNGCVILAAHPSLTGMNTGTGLSGSTAWNNSVRSRLYLTRPTRLKGEEDEPDDDGVRLLRVMKSNYAPAGGRIRLTWQQGIFELDPVLTGGGSIVDRIDLQVRLLEEMRRFIAKDGTIAASAQAKNSFPKVVRGYFPTNLHLPRSQLEAVLAKLIQDGKVVEVKVGKPSRFYLLLRPSDSRYQEEIP